jgi:hypothetical protein
MFLGPFQLLLINFVPKTDLKTLPSKAYQHQILTKIVLDEAVIPWKKKTLQYSS